MQIVGQCTGVVSAVLLSCCISENPGTLCKLLKNYRQRLWTEHFDTEVN